ncbi:MAG: anti-sigma factor [Pyrinomonadaceae bacterium]
MSECLAEEILQGYLDAELSGVEMESITSHLGSCSNCASLMRELEDENRVLVAALAPEFAVSVPTERLRQRIHDAVAQSSSSSSRAEAGATFAILHWLRSASDQFSFTPQRALAYSGLAAVVLFAFAFVVIQRERPVTPVQTQVVASNQETNGKPAATSIAPSTAPIETASVSTAKTVGVPATVVSPSRHRPRNNSIRETSPRRDATFSNHVRLLPGERTYLQTIADLDSTIKRDKGRMKPAIQAEYQRNLAFVDRALAAARTAAKSNPNDPDAADFMFSAYQSKVDLLNTVADARVYDKQH